MKKVAVLTGGGDAPGLNAVIRGIVRKLHNNGVETIGIIEGWRGIIEGNTQPLTIEDTLDTIHIGGTMIGSSRTNPFKEPEKSIPKIIDNVKKLGIDCLIAIGGDDTLGAAAKLYQQEKIPTVGVPKTIDNDLRGTEYTFGFDTAISRATEAFDWLRTTAKSHRRCLVVECMGRHAGWITAFSGIAGGADYILIPEKEPDIEELCAVLKRNRERGKKYNLVAVSEGAKLAGEEVLQTAEKDEFGNVRLGGVGQTLAKIIEKKTGIECRHVVLGHLQRGGPPSAYDRVLGTRYGLAAAQAALDGKFGKMVALRGDTIVTADISEVQGGYKTLRPDILAVLEEFST